MALANINYNLNHTEDTAYIVIKNDKGMLESLFNGLFVVARRHLGYNPNASSHPFITRCYSKDATSYSKHERQDLEYAKKHYIVVTPDADKHKTNEVLTITLNGSSQLIRKAIEQANEGAEPEDRLNYTDANVNSIYMALVEDYWNDMVAYAKENRYYAKNWQSIANTA